MDKERLTEPEPRILFIDDQVNDLRILETFARKSQFTNFISFTNAIKALEWVNRNKPLGNTLIVSDIRMPGMDGFELLAELKKSLGSSPVVMISGDDDLETATRAMREGAVDFITKPVNYAIFDARVRRAFNWLADKEELSQAVDNLSSGYVYENFIGKSEAIQKIHALIRRVAKFDATVLITGESGVGKERVARAIHNMSPRRDHEFIAVNCAAIPENLIESELFGHQKGAFTGADRDHNGLFMAADKGTIFLDEIAELPLQAQAKVLRVLQDREVRPVGGSKVFHSDVRIICATHRNLQELVQAKLFREDLFYRLNVIPLHIPPLRERKEDLDVLIPYFMSKNMQKWRLQKKLMPAAKDFLYAYEWPGNVRELDNLLERAFILSNDDTISREHFDIAAATSLRQIAGEGFFRLGDGPLPSLRDIELAYIKEVLARTHTKEEAARILQIGRKTLYRKEGEIDALNQRPMDFI